MATKNYTVPTLAKWFNSFPHYNLQFLQINNTFSPEESDYQEALGFWAAVPAAWLTVTLFFFLVYFCARCCSNGTARKHPAYCLRWTIGILSLIALTGVAIGLYGNVEANQGVHDFATATESANKTITGVETQVNVMNSGLTDMMSPLDRLRDLVTEIPGAEKIINDTIAEVKKLVSELGTIPFDQEGVNLQLIADDTRFYEYYRFMGTVLLLVLEIVVGLVALCGVGRGSRCLLIFMTCLAFLCLFVCFGGGAVYLAAGVGAGDFCVSPSAYIKDQVKDEVIPKAVLEYYINCHPTSVNPFSQTISRGRDGVSQAKDFLREVEGLTTNLPGAKEIITEIGGKLNTTESSFDELVALVRCQKLNEEYVDALNAVCYDALEGVAYMLVSSLAVGLLFTVSMVLASLAWQRLGRRKQYIEIDEEDPFLPPSGMTPTMNRTSQGPLDHYLRGGDRGEREPLMRDNRTPPPSYTYAVRDNRDRMQDNQQNPTVEKRQW
ncbi:protein tweety homolog 1-like isoform X2 [Branchiostoma floridae]|uniref:Protein tweety homolog n=1 Tax=Branchiostoma floridae TaxID=7739 RepID=A0A9J7M5G2_BRAFL|nr:protein tweety homolog 1-like isoform X2 [Branchiostoma floridae]